MSLLGIDIGTSSCKGVVFTYEGEIISKRSKKYSLYITPPNIVEANAEELWYKVIEIIKELAQQATYKNDPIEAIAISSHGETFIPIDKEGNPVGPAIMNADNRALEESNWLEKVLGKEKIYAITGLPAHPMYSLPKILWLKRHKPEIYASAKKFVGVADFILSRLGLALYTDYSLASRTMLFDIRKRSWSDEILEAVEIDPERLSVPLPAGEKLGTIDKEIAKELGLSGDVVITLGGHDQPCGALGAGVTNQETVYDSAGTYECLVAVSDSPMNTKEAFKSNLNSYCHVIPNKYVTLAFSPGGMAVQWFLKEFCSEEVQDTENLGVNEYEILNKNIPESPTGICFIPHLVGSGNPSWNPNAKGIISGITLSTTKYHIYKAIFEGIACELAINIKVLEEILGKVDTIYLSGGTAKTDFSIQIRSDITNKKIKTLINQETVCLGTAILAGTALGVYKDILEGIQKTVKFGKEYLPQPINIERYKIQKRRYELFYSTLIGLWNEGGG